MDENFREIFGRGRFYNNKESVTFYGFMDYVKICTVCNCKIWHCEKGHANSRV